MKEGGDCSCSDNLIEEPLLEKFVTVPKPLENQEQSIDWDAVAETAGMGAVTAVAAIATVALALLPLDGPAGEIAAGTGTASAAARTASAFGRIFKPAPL